MNKIKILLFVMLSALLTASLGLAADKTFQAKLTGDEEVPSVKTSAKGEAKIEMKQEGKELKYWLKVEDIDKATVAHLHHGMKGKNGPPVATLFNGPPKEGKFSGDLAEGMLAMKDLTGDLKGKSIEDLVKLINAGECYVNVHTVANPDGEIRGQLK